MSILTRAAAVVADFVRNIAETARESWAHAGAAPTRRMRVTARAATVLVIAISPLVGAIIWAMSKAWGLSPSNRRYLEDPAAWRAEQVARDARRTG